MKTSLLTIWVFLTLISCNTDKKTGNPYPTATIERYYHLSFTPSERDSLFEGIERNILNYQAIYKYPLLNSTPPSLNFNPIPLNFEKEQEQGRNIYSLPEENILKRPKNDSEIAFMSIAELSTLIKTGQITSTELTKIYINRLKKYGDSLQCVITITEELALDQAKRADAEIASGKYKGLLHGIPYGVKDLLSVEGYNTTWGATPFINQQFDETATVVKKLEEAGAVLIAKLTMGALAMGDVWYGGVTKSPWNTERGSSGSSAGSASATVAGLVGFSLGTETLGSIVSPSTRCGATGLRPSYGRVSRTGAMALSWSMDKIGPICRNAQDCAIVFDYIRGTDGIDQTLVDIPFNYRDNNDFKDLKVGYIKEYFESDRTGKNDSITLQNIREMGVELREVSMPDDLPIGALRIILVAEAAAAFDSLTRSDEDDLLVRQDKGAWPNIFRGARFIPAVEYINANRIRYELIQKVHEAFKEYDVIITPSYGGSQLLVTNLTGTPCVVVPNGFDEEGNPTSISFIGKLYGEAPLLEFARAFQQHTDWDEMHPGFQ